MVMRVQALHSLIVTTFLLCCPLIGAMAVDGLPKQFLIFGGNGMLGSATVERLLLSRGEDDSIVVVNRGNWYWDSAFTVRPFVHHIKCDRMNKLANCPELSNFVTKVPYIDAVVDFSAYHPQSITEALDLVEGKAKLYVYISTDSVYEVCTKNHTYFTKEEDAVRPTSETEKEEIQTDHYGNRKLECEETLSQYRKGKNGPPYISLRLPDVIGPRDNTYRWWVYQLWMKLREYLEKPVSVPASISSKKLSFVYVNDVACMIATLLQDTPENALDEAFNLAIIETPTLLDVLNDMKNILNLTNLKIIVEENSESIRLYPSVRKGAVDISKAKKILGWNPTEWPIIVKETVKFYETALKEVHFSEPKHNVIQTIQTHFTSKPYDVIRGLKHVYGLSFAEPKDEL